MVVVVEHVLALPHVSQQLGAEPTVPPLSVHAVALFLILHFVPEPVVRQQVRASTPFPQVDRAAHFFTAPLQLLGRVGLVPLDSMLAT